MRKSTVTWRLTFATGPSEQLLRTMKEKLDPITKVEPSPGHGLTLREYGLSEYDFVEPERELTPGEIALSCIVKAHRLARGWALMWPGTRGNAVEGWPEQELSRAIRPEYLHGFAGVYVESGERAGSSVPGLHAASFTVQIAQDAPTEVRKPARAAQPPAELAPPATGPEAIAITTALLNLLVSYRTYGWVWDTATVRRQIVGLGATPLDDAPDGETYRLRDGMIVRLVADGSAVRTVEFVLVEQRNPHMLDETAFARLQTRFEALFSTAVHAAKSLLGQPAFAGASGEDGFPADQWAEFAALWPQPTHRILVEVQHNDRELPMRLCLVFAPPQTRG